ncbi:hypothetical protein CJ667_04180, partial [Aliarcobacter cryaerophilus]
NKDVISHIKKLGLDDNLLEYEKNKILDIERSIRDVVNYQEINTCIIPIDKSKILGKELYDRLNILLRKMVDINNKYVGQIVTSALINLSENKEYFSIRNEFLELSKEYCSKRISKINNKDKDQVDRYYRIYHEILPWFDQKISIRENTIFYSFIDLFLEYIPYFLYEHTFKQYVEIKDRTSINLIGNIALEKREFIKNQLYLYNFHQNFLKELLSLTNSIQLSSNLESLNKDELLKKVFELAQDIKWWGTFMSSSYKDSDNLIPIIKDEFDISWAWNFDNSIGFISFWFDNNELNKQLKKKRIFQVVLNYDGVFEDKIRRWISTLNINNIDNLYALKINLFILEKIYSYLENIYNKIDHNKILNQFMNKHNNNLIIEDEEKNIADLDDVKFDKNEIFTIKQSRLLIILKSIGCEIREGKGSEISIYKFGGKHYTMGHHKKDEYIYPPTIINILKTLNISPKDFMQCLKKIHPTVLMN